MVVDMEVDMAADTVANMAADKKIAWRRVGHGGRQNKNIGR